MSASRHGFGNRSPCPWLPWVMHSLQRTKAAPRDRSPKRTSEHSCTNSRITEVVLSQSLRSMSFHCPSTCPKFASLEFFQIFFNTRLPELVLFHCHQFHAAAIAVTAALASLPETSPVFMNCLNMSCESPEISIAALGNHGCAVFCVNRRMLLAQGLANDLTIRWLCRSHPG